MTGVKEKILREIEGLPEQRVYEVIDFVRFLKFKTTEPEQEWFWSKEWQEKEKEADKALSGARFTDFATPEEAICWLNR